VSDSFLSQEEIDALLSRTKEEEQKKPPVPAEVSGEQPVKITQQQIERILDIPLQIEVVLGRVKKTIGDTLIYFPGNIVDFNRSVADPVDIILNDKLIARGEVVVVDEYYGVQITQIVAPEERLHEVKKEG
jgi:flagellar motor switch protein FliN/FliY